MVASRILLDEIFSTSAVKVMLDIFKKNGTFSLSTSRIKLLLLYSSVPASFSNHQQQSELHLLPTYYNEVSQEEVSGVLRYLYF
mmetsp:Transcript_56490/g.66008  ORF Transcript_56490/g.66008 Transcript_56490/m.66008 type:complete len:84 (-) Transcript_56490:801-1052(-)